MDPESVRAGSRVPHGGTTDPTVLDFSANTNPERPDGVEAVYREAFDASTRYPDDDYADFRGAAGDYVGCVPEAVVPTAGGLEALRLAFEVTLSPGDTALVPEPSFGEYDREIRLQGAEPVAVAHDAILDADPADHAVAVVCTPNNPTGELAPADDLRAFAARCREAETTLVVDEAFLDFTDEPSLAGEPGVVVARSLTKMFGLPGIRAGFAVATGDLGDRLAVARRAWSLSTPAAAVGAYCMDDAEFVSRTRARVSAERERLRETLSDAFAVSPSDAPFLLVDVGDRDVDAVVETARDRGVAVRDATTFPTLDSHVRVAVKRPDENDELLRALAAVADDV
ncbi:MULTISPECIES: threonine-phosphate decarboxylase CobD [unclassified Haloferax]|uniref:Threonine-phosphate decarboxylase CobD n=1 Tax=Haloferax sp. Atlit-48N TaxID=2077198 RepID=A0ACD5HXI2_9EURY|nr:MULTISPECIES: threonine-phosphate decarboxylase CobD [unclassified Haloferax]MBC9985389.1 threonine-phosphate decarboxylase [Haloferax sp. AS1]RDZ33219.1 threonine-phosphate decarboxylase [Haloferax sp. Atlit-48N]RDZ37089.1 threonine-phosphate decarboxylase [Haloferax sp. Atlit-24N]RDZ41405.1 threonine-phosphate decarboxylase [Haloferax sp. Atlit-47N]RLM37886.1 threonine-phosphate decarboxylase [Haloferax sp. Atlit-109R]